MPAAPYIIFGFDVSQSANAAEILKDVEDNFPVHGGIGALSIGHVFTLSLPPANALAAFAQIADYLAQKDAQFQGALRWFVQFCRTNELAGN